MTLLFADEPNNYQSDSDFISRCIWELLDTPQSTADGPKGIVINKHSGTIDPDQIDISAISSIKGFSLKTTEGL